jgi:hypothetical protein
MDVRKMEREDFPSVRKVGAKTLVEREKSWSAKALAERKET